MKAKISDFRIGKIYIIDYDSLTYEQALEMAPYIYFGDPVIISGYEDDKIKVLCSEGKEFMILPRNLYKGAVDENILIKMQKKYKSFRIYEKFRIKIALFICIFEILYLALNISKILISPIVSYLVIFAFFFWMVFFLFDGEYELVKKENDFFTCEAIDKKGNFQTNLREMEIQKLIDMVARSDWQTER